MTDGRLFSFSVETDITFGAGARRNVGTAARRFGRRAAVVASGSAFLDSATRDEIEDALRGADVEIVLTCRATGEPTLNEAIQAGEAMARLGTEVVIAIGGGSALDLGKAAAIAALKGSDLARLAAGERFDASAVPVVALPTTAGSGAEASRAAIVHDEAAGRKRGIRGRGVAARAALVDPELVVGCPPKVTAHAGFDALAHAFETAMSRASTPFTRLLSVEAVRLLLDAVPRSLEEPADLQARSAASYAALLMGINLANSTTCLPHRMQYPVGALTRTEHASGVAALMPAWLWRTLELAPERLAELGPALGGQSAQLTGARAVVEAALDFMQRVELRPRLRDLGIRREDLPLLASMVEGSVENDPGPSHPAAILALYEASY